MMAYPYQIRMLVSADRAVLIMAYEVIRFNVDNGSSPFNISML